MLGVGVWDLKGEEGSGHGDGKANVCWARQRQWDTETMGHASSLRVSPTTPRPYSFQISLMIAIFLKQAHYLNFSGS